MKKMKITIVFHAVLSSVVSEDVTSSSVPSTPIISSNDNKSESTDKRLKRVSLSYSLSELPENNIRGIYKKPLLGKQSMASLMSIDPLKIDSDIFREGPLLNELSLDEDGIPPPPEFIPKSVLTSDKSSEISFHTSKSTNSSYSERLQDIKQQYRQFQDNLKNQNKSSGESSDQLSFHSISNTSLGSRHFEEMRFKIKTLLSFPPMPSSMQKTNKS
ncbi:hypothetical protein LY90DRAFT_49311 [Neocallimastix californiae]|uniref:Uncharacterized protein n=1 Tax=Neocallimastix californiae TaxID=1754190 RepID=A0A1Y1XAE8_9FUNG|nr:hypothetical protein LY90DRAFT_49311 [Neocallimastix californiae]|eukprot:ORX82710.1 hypothetical protein LY90DRAFT_49311 [Neocallimastix californiae]